MEEETLNKYLEAGKVAAQALDYGRSLVKPGARLIDVAEKIEARIVELGAQPAFPVNISFDDTAAGPGRCSTGFAGYFQLYPNDPALPGWGRGLYCSKG